MKPVWRVIDTGYLACSQNLAWDKALLLACKEGLIPDTLRFFQFASDCVLLGHYQIAEQEVRLDFCQKQFIDINRRMTGGNTVYWDSSMLGWEVVLQRPECAAKQVEILYRQIGAAVIRGLRALGVNARYRYPSVIELEGRQIGWFSGTRQGSAFFYQGYIYVSDINVNTLLHALRIPTEKLINKEINLFKKNLASLDSVLGKTPSFTTIKSAIADGFCQTFSVSAMQGKMNPVETYYYDTIYREVSSRQWVFGKQEAIAPSGCQLRSTSKEQSVINVSMSIDICQQRIRAISIAGDFDAYPLEIIPKLERDLSGIAAKPELIRNIVNDCFTAYQACVVTSTADDVSKTIIRALEKLHLLKWGALPEDLHDITVTGKWVIQNIYEQAVTPLLIPYCAKDISCKYRYIEGCGRCGRCDVSDAYTLADEYGLEPITIQNYEMLEEKLKTLKKNGCKVFIGTCCESFWVKHTKDFEEIGLPGILINVDNNTCYELGKEQVAHRGRFENQTRLKQKLIRRIINGLLNNKDSSIGLTS